MRVAYLSRLALSVHLQLRESSALPCGVPRALAFWSEAMRAFVIPNEGLWEIISGLPRVISGSVPGPANFVKFVSLFINSGVNESSDLVARFLASGLPWRLALGSLTCLLARARLRACESRMFWRFAHGLSVRWRRQWRD